MSDFYLHFYNKTKFETYEAAKEAGEVVICEAPADEDQVDSWGFDGGVLCDAMQVVNAVLKCAKVTDCFDAVLFDRDTRLMAWSDET
jgi:hypothetical protein